MANKFDPNPLIPGPQLRLRVRSRFVEIGSSLNAWCAENGINRQNAGAALMGKWNGSKAVDLRKRIAKHLAEKGAPL